MRCDFELRRPRLGADGPPDLGMAGCLPQKAGDSYPALVRTCKCVRALCGAEKVILAYVPAALCGAVVSNFGPRTLGKDRAERLGPRRMSGASTRTPAGAPVKPRRRRVEPSPGPSPALANAGRVLARAQLLPGPEEDG